MLSVRGAGRFEESVARLEQLALLSREQFLADRDSQDIAYWKLDYNRVYDIVQSDLGDLRSFASAMAALL